MRRLSFADAAWYSFWNLSAFFLTAVLDILKAFAAYQLCRVLFPDLSFAGPLGGVMCIMGHIFPVLLGFRGGKGMASLARKIPADITPERREEIRALAVKAFQALGCNGVSRIDFMIDEDTDNVYFNEINTIPGSLSFYLWQPLGVPYTELLDRMIDLALKRRREEDSITFSFDTNILSVDRSFGGSKGGKLGAKSGGKF